MDGSCGFSGLMNADHPSSPNGYFQRPPPPSTCSALSVMDSESILQPVVYGYNESLPAVMAAEDASYSLMEEDNIVQYLGENLWVSEYYNLQNVEQPGGYFQQQLQQQYNNATVRECRRITPLASEITPSDESSFKVGRLSAEERKEKINRYVKKRSERNFSKKIKYACRKTLADSRPRIRGRFAKNEEFGEVTMATSSQVYDDDDDLDEVIVKEEDFFNSPDIIADVTEVLSFKHNYTTL